MNIAELFVNLGVKGADNAKKAIGGVKDGLGDVKSMSLEAKAAVIGAIYALERMMSSSAKAGTGFLNFGSLTGLSMQELQKWQYAARQAGVDGEELTGSLKGVQNSMTNMLMGKGAPEGMAMLANSVGFDTSKARDSFYVLEQLQKFAQTVPEDVGNAMIKSFGVSENTIAAMRRNAFNPNVMSNAPKYSDGEINQLNKVDVAMSNLNNKFQMAIGHLTSKHGMAIIKDFTILINVVGKAADQFIKLAEKIKLVEMVGEIFKGWGMIFEAMGSGIDKLMELMHLKDALKNDGGLKKNPLAMARDFVGEKMDDIFATKDIQAGRNVAPNMKPTGSNKVITNHAVVNQHFQHAGTDPKKHADETRRGIKEAYSQLSRSGI
jgi:hypothetical protein